MKQKFSLAAILLFLTFSSEIFCQDNSWTGIHLTVAGHNTMDGVEASFKQGNCNGEEVVFIELINHNDYDVSVTWSDAVFTQELKWVQKENKEEKTFLLPAAATVKGDCSEGNVVLMIWLKDFIKDKKDFKRYGAANFTVAKK